MTPAKRARIIARDSDEKGAKCRKCGSHLPPFEVDHEIGLFFNDVDPERWPVALLDADDNLRTLCIDCHVIHTRQQAKLRGKIRRIDKQRLPSQKKKRAWSIRKIPSRPFAPSRLKAARASPPISGESHGEEDHQESRAQEKGAGEDQGKIR